MSDKKAPENTVFILGAGFSSAAAGVTLQKGFLSELLADPPKEVGYDHQIHMLINNILRDFLKKTFYWSGNNDDLPALEDIFTCIDLAANSGHTLGEDFPPNKLRVIRRMAIFRILEVVSRPSQTSDCINGLIKFFAGIEPSGSSNTKLSFVVTNWDVVLEHHLMKAVGIHHANYGLYGFDSVSGTLLPIPPNPEAPYLVCKMHGSSNWHYCEHCKNLFFDEINASLVLVKVGLGKKDFELFKEFYKDDENVNSQVDSFDDKTNRNCKSCGLPQLAPHIATFSYRKSFRTHVYPSVWYHAEQVLSEADHWVFMGYSLPAADYEFKHLLKTAQLRMMQKLKPHNRGSFEKPIDVVALEEQGPVQQNYDSFFGKKNVKFYGDGIDGYCKAILG